MLDADKDLRRLHTMLGLRSLDDEVEASPIPSQPRPDLRLEVEKLVADAKPFIAAVAIDQVPSRHSEVIRGLSRLEISVCEELVIRYELAGEVRERDDAVSYIAIRQEEEGPIIKRRIGTAHLELDPQTGRPHWYAFGPQLAHFLNVPNLGDAFALLLAAKPSERRQYMAARRISVPAVDAARLELNQPEEDLDDMTNLDQELLAGKESPRGDRKASADQSKSDSDAMHDSATDVSDALGDPTEGGKVVEFPELELENIEIEDVSDPIELEGRSAGRGAGGLGPMGPIDHEAQQRLQRHIGRRGEEVAYEAEKQRLAKLGRDPALVVWRSKDHELAPYDIESLDADGQQIYIEVKATVSDDPSDPFEISGSELVFGLQKRGSYYIYRVTSVHESRPDVRRYQDPLGRVRDRTAVLSLGSARMTLSSSPPDREKPR